ncbi:MAG: hypothetical protein K6E84_08170 [Lachnospiraceae bacterium]|nr:hypothetical protein [Lachnospiraceae bacterium]
MKMVKKYYPIIIYGGIWLLLQLSMKVWIGDETVYAALLEQKSVAGVFSDYYYHWSSRVFWDVLCAIAHHYPLAFFKLANSLVMTLECLGILKLCDRDESISVQWIIAALLSSFSYVCFYDCGFSVTSIYYIWPATAAIWSILLIRQSMQNDGKVKLLNLAGVILLTAAADNMEQFLIVVTGVQLFWFGKMLIDKKFNSYIVAGLLTSVCSMVFTFTAPGRGARYTEEIMQSFPEYSMLGFIQKVNLGFSIATREIAFSGNVVCLIATFYLAALFFYEKKSWERVIGCIPFSICMVFGPLYPILGISFPHLYMLKSVETYGVGDLTDFDMPYAFVPLGFMIFFWASLLIALWLLYDSGADGWLLITAVFAGMLSRLGVAFSPTIFSSGNRTDYPMWCVFLILAVFLAVRLKERKPVWLKAIPLFLGSCSLLVFISILK